MGDPLGILSAGLRRDVERRVAQVALIAPVTGGQPEDLDLDYWVTVCRKILQRGVRPPLSPRVDAGLGVGQPDATAADVMAAIAASAPPAPLDPAYALDPQWERPFWERAQLLAPDAVPWLIPQAPLEALVTGDIPPQVGRRWVDFLYAPPGQAPVVFEIDGRSPQDWIPHGNRRQDADPARDALLGSAGVAVVRADGAAALDRDGPLFRRLIQQIAPASKQDHSSQTGAGNSKLARVMARRRVQRGHEFR